MFNRPRNFVITFNNFDYRKSNLGTKCWDKRVLSGYISHNLDPVLRINLLLEDILILAFTWILDYAYIDPTDAKDYFTDGLQALIDDYNEDSIRYVNVSDQQFKNALIVITDISDIFEVNLLRIFKATGKRWSDYQINNVYVQGDAYSVEFIERDPEI